LKDSEFKVGDTVYCTIHGEGIVIDVTNHHKWAVGVKLKSGDTELYHADGRFDESLPRTLFFSPTWIHEGSRIRPFTDGLVGKNVLVQCIDEDGRWYHYGKVLCQDDTRIVLEEYDDEETKVRKSTISSINEIGDEIGL
jgi:hypothetical protein